MTHELTTFCNVYARTTLFPAVMQGNEREGAFRSSGFSDFRISCSALDIGMRIIFDSREVLQDIQCRRSCWYIIQETAEDTGCKRCPKFGYGILYIDLP